MNAWMARNLVYRPATWMRGEAVFRLLRRYEATQWWSPEELRRLQEELLERLLRYAVGHTPHYREMAARVGLDATRIEAGDLERLPILTKHDLVERADRLRAPRLPGTTSWKTTGGSTGVAVRLRKNRGATAAEQAASWRSYAWYGIRPGDRQARFWGIPQTTRARLRSRAIDGVLNRDRFSAFAFRREHLGEYFERMRRTRPVWAYGYVSMLVQLAAYCREEKLPLDRLGVRAVVTTSEVLTESDLALIASAFGAPVFNEYGCGEVGAILYECEKDKLHLMAENLFVELRPDPTQQEPQACRLVVTDLHNLATPLIRYDLEDRVVPALPCACGRGLPAFDRVFGRAYDFLEASDGTRFHGEFFLYLLEEARDQGLPVRQAQFVQTGADAIEIRWIPEDGQGDRAGTWLARELEKRSHAHFRVTAVPVSSIPRERSGKLRLIVGLAGSRATSAAGASA